MKEDYKVDPLSIKFDQTKKDTRRDAWDRDYLPLNRNELEEATKIEPKKDYTIWLLVLFLLLVVQVLFVG